MTINILRMKLNLAKTLPLFLPQTVQWASRRLECVITAVTMDSVTDVGRVLAIIVGVSLALQLHAAVVTGTPCMCTNRNSNMHTSGH